MDDADFLAPPDRPSKDGLPPWATPERRRHPKNYVQFLCDPTGTIARPYVEAKGGRAALRDLAWEAVLTRGEHARFVRSLIHDLADALGEHAVAERFSGQTHAVTWPPPRDNLLRNL